MNLVQEDLVGTWEVALPGGIHVIQFEHGTTTGKRVIHVDGIEVRQMQHFLAALSDFLGRSVR